MAARPAEGLLAGSSSIAIVDLLPEALLDAKELEHQSLMHRPSSRRLLVPAEARACAQCK